MIQRVSAYGCMVLGSCIMSLQLVTASVLLPQQELMTTKAKVAVEKQIAAQGATSAYEIYEKLQIAYEKEKNPYVRMSLHEIIQRMSQTYRTTPSTPVLGVAKDGRTTIKVGANNPDPNERVFLKDGKPYNPSQPSRQIEALPITPKPTISTSPQREPEPVKPVETKKTKKPIVEHLAADEVDEELEEKLEEKQEVKKTESRQSSSYEVTSPKGPHDTLSEGASSASSTSQDEVVQSGRDEYYMLRRGRINLTSLQTAWVDWVNEVRARPDLQRAPIVLEPVLHKTAAQWAQTMRNRDHATHERTAGDGYYNYPKIEQWFSERGVGFELRNRSTFTENIGYAWFDCDANDCTDVALDSMRRVFEFFIGEEGQSYDAHWETTIHPEFRQVGIGISVDEENNWIYMAAHYATKVIQKPVGK